MPATGKVVLDTSVVVASLRRMPGTAERLQEIDELLVPLTVLGELEYGAERASHPFRQREATRVFMEAAVVLLPSMQTAREYGRLKAALAVAGKPIPENDLWIAAVAMEHGLPVATRDLHFSQVPGLMVLDWR